jgi:peroxiredoxin
MVRTDNIYEVPKDLPAPIDDGACDHLTGMRVPSVPLHSTAGRSVDPATLPGRTVLYCYPRTGRPDVEPPQGWNEIAGARGCTPQSCAFRDHAAELAALGARVAGLSAQSLDDQVEFAERNRMPFPIVADEQLELARALGLPTFEADGATLYRRLALVAERGRIVKVFYPVFPPDRNAEEVLAWMSSR